MKSLKKIIALLVVAVLVMTTMVACGNSDKKEEEASILAEIEEAKEEQRKANEKVENLYSKLHTLYESMFKKNPAEEEMTKNQDQLNSMIDNQLQTQQPAVSINAGMFH